MNALLVARRELAAYFHAPIAYVVGVLFLAVQGLSFWALVQALSNPAAPAPIGAVLQGHFGGTVLSWAVIFAVVAALSMRLVAEEKSRGTWELLLTTRLPARTILLGKWLGAVAFYAVLWAPTLLYLLVLARYAPAGVGFDPGPVASAYLGVLLAGAGFLAVGLAASTATRNQIVAAVTTFAVLLMLLVLGQIPQLVPSLADDAPRLAAVLHWIDPRAHMDRFSRGAIDLGPVVFYLGLSASGLALATALASVGRRRRGLVGGRFIAAALTAIIAIEGSLVVARHPHRWDTSAAGSNSLDPVTRGVLARVDAPVDLLVIRPGEAEFAPVWAEVDRVVDRMLVRQPLLSRRDLDPSLEPDRARSLADEFAIAPADLVDYGAVVVQSGDRRRVVDLIDLAQFERDAVGAGKLQTFRAEAAIASAVAEVTWRDRAVVCATVGHGELPAHADGGDDWSGLAARLEREGMAIEEVGSLAGGVPAYCRVLLVFAPTDALPADDALAVKRYLDARGSVLLFASAEISTDGDQPRLPVTGLELVLEPLGITLPQAVAVDPSPDASVGVPGAFRVTHGYGDHPISAAFRDRRVSVWQLPRVVGAAPSPEDGAHDACLVETTKGGWGETDLARAGASTAADADDLPGPACIAAAGWDDRTGGRAVVFGSAVPFTAAAAKRGLTAGEPLAASAALWLAGRDRVSGSLARVGDKTPEQLRLVMSSGERTGTFVFCVLIIPLLFAAAGAIAWRIRRRG